MGLYDAIDSCRKPSEVWVFTANIHLAYSVEGPFLSHKAIGQMEYFEIQTLCYKPLFIPLCISCAKKL